MRQDRVFHRSTQGPGHELSTYLVRAHADNRHGVPAGYYAVTSLRGSGLVMRSLIGPLDQPHGRRLAQELRQAHAMLYEKLADMIVARVDDIMNRETVH